VCVAGTDLRLDSGVWLDRALYQALYERTELELVSRLVQPGDSCIDVGANVGIYSVLFAARSVDGPVIAFEPSPTFLRLRENLRSLPNATALNMGLSDQSGTLPLARAGVDDVGASFRDGRYDDQRVPVQRLDQVQEVKALEQVDFLKIDVEGWEPAVMAGASELWARRGVGLALIEANPHWGSVDYLQQLQDLGYLCFEVRQKSRVAGLRLGLDLRPLSLSELRAQVNVLAVRPDFMARVTAAL
jgi:FkbM family methyltransferase